MRGIDNITVSCFVYRTLYYYAGYLRKLPYAVDTHNQILILSRAYKGYRLLQSALFCIECICLIASVIASNLSKVDNSSYDSSINPSKVLYPISRNFFKLPLLPTTIKGCRHAIGLKTFSLKNRHFPSVTQR
jgi:hypothetical protein